MLLDIFCSIDILHKFSILDLDNRRRKSSFCLRLILQIHPIRGSDETPLTGKSCRSSISSDSSAAESSGVSKALGYLLKSDVFPIVCVHMNDELGFKKGGEMFV
eukprot:TRINITY_DN33419_c0_g2_i1.p1 TRINITY_DN33419_c0_g2~~TRINITY_DN33419_c0_g2_i1.p1  ORF type:complete len:104 (-),score=2.48 TRINITY_DN33419_c0_g2_i1:174-485(-)